MQKQTKGNITWLFSGLCGISALAWLVNSQAPTFWPIVYFLTIIFATTSTLTFFVLGNLRRSTLIAGGVTGYLLLRMIELKEPLYLILLVACLISLELYLAKR